ncbi:hypothetical protein AVEN_97804-1 [Araneus ventricosus]|uniref:Histone-lysine N-methyltransferase SETMAR n=1 Tax=Araneus ventricosus TaxID=182803 RepID=A0A4Y2WW13_ARAVE|nr:hypothetical protein AVEN_97804-1 [Araneus ventricosus]
MHSGCPSRGKLSNRIVLLRDNARPHVAKKTLELLEKFRWEVLQHPPCSPYIPPCHYHILGPLKKSLKAQSLLSHDTCDKEVQDTVKNWIRQQPRSFNTAVIHSLPKRWDPCINSMAIIYSCTVSHEL